MKRLTETQKLVRKLKANEVIFVNGVRGAFIGRLSNGIGFYHTTTADDLSSIAVYAIGIYDDVVRAEL